MTNKLTVGLIRGSLPSYFPQKHGVWTAATAALEALCDAEGVHLHVAPGVPMNEQETRTALDDCRAEGGGFHPAPARRVHDGRRGPDDCRRPGARGLLVGAGAATDR